MSSKEVDEWLTGLFNRRNRSILALPEGDAAARQIIGRHFHRNMIPEQNADVVLAHLAGEVSQHDVVVIELYTEPGPGQGLDNEISLEQQKLAVQSGAWPVYRYDPRLATQNENPLLVENKEPSIPISQYAYNETRYKMLVKMDEGRAEKLLQKAQQDAKPRWNLYQQMAAIYCDSNKDGDGNSKN